MQMLASPIKGIEAECVYQTKGIYLYMHAQKKPYLCKTIKEEEKVKRIDVYHPIARLVSLASFERARICGPNLKRMNGRKVNRVAIRARSNPAYWLPMLWKNCDANKGDTAPRVLRMKP